MWGPFMSLLEASEEKRRVMCRRAEAKRRGACRCVCDEGRKRSERRKQNMTQSDLVSFPRGPQDVDWSLHTQARTKGEVRLHARTLKTQHKTHYNVPRPGLISGRNIRGDDTQCGEGIYSLINTYKQTDMAATPLLLRSRKRAMSDKKKSPERPCHCPFLTAAKGGDEQLRCPRI